MLRSRLGALIVVSGAAAIGLAGCGDDSESTSESTPQEAEAPAAEAAPEVTKEDYIAAADDLCAAVKDENTKLAKERAALSEELASTPSTEAAKQVQKIVEQLNDNRKQLTKDLLALEEPASGGADAYIESRKDVEKRLDASAEAWGTYADQLDETSVTALNEAVEAESKAVEENTDLAKEFGFKECGQLILKAKD